MPNNNYLLLTGATSDIGSSIAKQLSDRYNLVLLARNKTKISNLLASIKSTNDIRVLEYDLKSIDDLDLFIQEFLIENDINISDFIHCAGAIRILPFRNFRKEYYDEIFNVNFFSAVEILKALLKKRNRSALRNIIFISAIYSKFGNIGNSMYASSKGALDSLVKTLALELAPNTRVNSILPGGIITQMTKLIFEDSMKRAEIEKEYPLGIGECLDIANMVEFLISEKAKWITGQNYFVDGGRSCI